MLTKIPGTTLDMAEQARGDPFCVIEPIINITGGLTLAQVVDITGLRGSTIQNWVKRGWVANPQGKRYGETQLVRIILINLLRGAMRLEDIVLLMRYINGSVEDRSDDIIPDRELYTFLCAVIQGVPSGGFADTKRLKRMIDSVINGYTEPVAGAKRKLSQALTVMALAYQAAVIKGMVSAEFSRLGIG